MGGLMLLKRYVLSSYHIFFIIPTCKLLFVNMYMLTPPLCVKAANDQIIKTLQKENAMITTAWYDLSSRLQSNHVVLARRQDAPKSWINKQRQMVNGEFFFGGRARGVRMLNADW